MYQENTEHDNRMVWDGGTADSGTGPSAKAKARGWYEVWYATFSHRKTSTGFWIRYTIEVPRMGDGAPYAQLWFSRFNPADPGATFGVSKRFPINAFRADTMPFSVSIGEAALASDSMRGSLAGGGQSIAWDLRWQKSASTYHHLPSLLYDLDGVDTKVLSPNPDIALIGTIVVDGETYTFDGDPGAQSHVWGRKHAYQWAWSHCNAFEGAPGAWFESISARLKRGQIILPTLTTFTLHVPGEELAFNELWSLPITRSSFGTGSYQLSVTTPETRVEMQLTCRPEDTLLAEYLDPDGDPAFNHISCCASAVATVKKRSPFVGRFRDHLTLRADRMAHFEWGARAGDVARVKNVLSPI